MPEHRDASRIRLEQAKEKPDRRRLARAIRSEKAIHGSLRDVHVELRHLERAADAVAKILRLDRKGHFGRPSLSSVSTAARKSAALIPIPAACASSSRTSRRA